MNSATRHHLRALNRRFYEARAAAFDATRRAPWPGWQRVLEAVHVDGESEPGEPLRVLDVGCGNGRFAHSLATRWSGGVRYLGLDASAALLERARRRAPERRGFESDWRALDVLAESDASGESTARANARGDGNPCANRCFGDKSALPEGPFDLIVAFGLLHHIPGSASRAAFVRTLHEGLSAGGLLALSIWRFGGRPRFARRILPWARWNEEAETPIDLAQLEPGDYLLEFAEEGGAPRYCHHCDDEEIARLAAPLGRRIEFFDADGRSGDLNRYLLAWRTHT